MKRIVLFSLLVVAFCSLVGCSTTRKAVKATSFSESQVTAQQVQTDERQTEQRQAASEATMTETLDLSNVVIEFTKVEYGDGYEVVPIDSTQRDASDQDQGKPATRNREGKSKPPNGVKSVTSGRITINGNRSETTQTKAEEATDITEYRSGIFKAQRKEQQDAKASTTEKTKVEKPGVKAVLIELCFCLLLVALAFLFLRHQIRKYNKT